MAYYEASSKYMQREVPPNYSQANQQPFRPIDTAAVLENGSPVIRRLEQFPALTTCPKCNLQVTTNVEKKLDTNGWFWVIICCCCYLFSFLVLCVNCFWKYNHFCPRCSTKIATSSPRASCRVKCILSLIGLLGFIICLMVLFVYAYLFYERFTFYELKNTMYERLADKIRRWNDKFPGFQLLHESLKRPERSTKS